MFLKGMIIFHTLFSINLSLNRIIDMASKEFHEVLKLAFREIKGLSAQSLLDVLMDDGMRKLGIPSVA